MKTGVMNLFLLDGAGAGLLVLFFGAGLIFIFLAIMIEAWIMQGLKYVPAFKTALLYSVVANFVSLIAGYLLTSISLDLFNFYNLAGFGLMFIMTLLLEFGVLYLLNREKPAGKTFKVCLLMNLATYGVAFLFWLVLS